MISIKEECIENINVSNIKLEEEKSKIIFKNPKRYLVKKIKVDGCLDIEGKRCDYLIRLERRNYLEEHFIELKGHDIYYAKEQLVNSIKRLGENSNFRQSYIIAARVPLASPQIQNWKLEFRGKYKSKLIVKESPFFTTFNIDNQ